MSSTALDFLLATAEVHHACLSKRGGTEATFVIALPSPSGAPGPRYLIQIATEDTWVTARELLPARLPAFCPERHINSNSSFCLFWAEEEPLEIVSAEAASTWWSKLLVFLRRQETAAKLGRWPGQEDVRAHGPVAARHQAAAERLAAELGPNFAGTHRAGRLTVSRHRHLGRSRLRLRLDGRRFISIADQPWRLMTLRAGCKCDEAQRRPRTLRSCGNHAAVLAEFVLALHGQAEAEKRFYDEIRAANLTCCCTIEDCPLAA